MTDIAVTEFIDILGLESTHPKVKMLLNKLNLPMPVLKDGEDSVWHEIKDSNSDTVFEIAFEDESLITQDKYADIGDGDLIFMAAYFNHVDAVELPFNITPQDNHKTIVDKIGRQEDDLFEKNTYAEFTWVFTTESNISYILVFLFDKSYESLKKVQLLYSYGQMSWVDQILEQKK